MEQKIPFQRESILDLQKYRPIKSLDGVHDLLTEFAIAPIFYDRLEREIGIAERYNTPFHLIRVQLLPLRQMSGSEYEIHLFNFSKLLKKVTRAEDLIARITTIEFTVIFHGELVEVDYLYRRINDNWWSIDMQAHISSTTYHLLEGQLSLLRRMDEADLHPLRQRVN